MSNHTGLKYIGVTLLLTSRLVACSSDSTPAAGGGGATGAGGGTAGASGAGTSGGKTGAGGAVGSGGSMADAGIPYTQTVCPGGQSVPGLMKNFPTCNDICGAPAHCVTTALASTQSTATGMLPDCPDDGAKNPGKCIPDGISETLGKFVFRECTFFLDSSKGRCVPTCIAARQSSSATVLQRDVCGAQEVCAPCTDPTNNNATTHACEDYCGGAGDGGKPDGGKKTDGG